MSHYPAFICENGHAISTSKNTCSDKFCSSCGAHIISKCPECQNTIQGKLIDTYSFMADYKVPAYCKFCGKPYPWTKLAIETTVMMLRESELSFEEQEKLINVLPDTLVETPKTQLASIRLKKAIAVGGPFVAEGLRDFVTNFACEAIKVKLGL